MSEKLLGTCIWIMVKSILIQSAFVCIALSADENIFVGVGLTILGTIAAFVASVPLLLLVYPIVKFSMKIPYSFRAQMVWLNFMLVMTFISILVLPFVISSSGMDRELTFILISLTASISFGCWTSGKSLRKLAQISHAYVRTQTH